MKVIKQFNNGLQVAKNNDHWCITDGYLTDYLRFQGSTSNWIRESNQISITQDIRDFLNKWAYIHYCAFLSSTKVTA